MYFEKEGNYFIVYNQSGYEVKSCRSESEARKFIKSNNNKRKEDNNRRTEKITYSSRED